MMIRIAGGIGVRYTGSVRGLRSLVALVQSLEKFIITLGCVRVIGEHVAVAVAIPSKTKSLNECGRETCVKDRLRSLGAHAIKDFLRRPSRRPSNITTDTTVYLL
jgi:hypothetical protein